MKKYLIILGVVVLLLILIFSSDRDGDYKVFKSCTIEGKSITQSWDGGSYDGIRLGMVNTSCGDFGLATNINDDENTKSATRWSTYQKIRIGETYDLLADNKSEDSEWLLYKAELPNSENFEEYKGM